MVKLLLLFGHQSAKKQKTSTATIFFPMAVIKDKSESLQELRPVVSQIGRVWDRFSKEIDPNSFNVLYATAAPR